MRAWLYVLAVLMATLKLIVPVASSISSSSSSSRSSGSTEEKQQLDPVALAQFEKTLFAQLGMVRRPHIVDRSKIVIPDELKEIFNKMMEGHELMDSVNLPMPGSHTKSANTIRSFAHEGKLNFFFFISI